MNNILLRQLPGTMLTRNSDGEHVTKVRGSGLALKVTRVMRYIHGTRARRGSRRVRPGGGHGRGRRFNRIVDTRSGGRRSESGAPTAVAAGVDRAPAARGRVRNKELNSGNRHAA